jgi:hypothetical protein
MLTMPCPRRDCDGTIAVSCTISPAEKATRDCPGCPADAECELTEACDVCATALTDAEWKGVERDALAQMDALADVC